MANRGEKTIKLLLVVGSANDIFIYNYAKWLKASMDVAIDVFEFYPSTQQGYGNDYYDRVVSAKSCGIPKVRVYVDPYLKRRQLTTFIKDRQYNIIHCHWVVSPLVLVKGLKKHCRKLIVTFWGGEFSYMSLWGSRKCYKKHLNEWSKEIDVIINDKESEMLLRSQLPYYKGLFYYASLGSTPLESLYHLMSHEGKGASKLVLGVPINKKSILIGYSGKTLHQHLPIIGLLRKKQELKEMIHLVVPMTRGASEEYFKNVKMALAESGYTYTLIGGRFLSDIEIARIRNATDIILQLSLSDGFSRSIIECLCAKSVMIYGEWLGYKTYLESAGFQALCVKSLEEGIEKIPEVLANINSYEDMLEHNHEKGQHKYIWSECIKDWVNAYNDLLK